MEKAWRRGLSTAPVDNPVDETTKIRLQPHGYSKTAKLTKKQAMHFFLLLTTVY
jgi:hypothetical protein